MQFIWIHHWTALPVIVEESRMSERNVSGSRLLLDQPGDESWAQPRVTEDESHPGSCQWKRGSLLAPLRSPTFSSNVNLTVIPATARRDTIPYELHFPGATPQPQSHHGQPIGLPGQYPSAALAGQLPSGGSFNMSGLVGALPEQPQSKDVQPTPSEPQRLQAMPSNPSLGYASHPIPSFAGPTPTNTSGYGAYAQQYAAPFPAGVAAAAAAQAYAQAPPGHQSHSGGPGPAQPLYTGPPYFPPQQPPAYLYYPGHFGLPSGQPHAAQSPQASYGASYARPPSGYHYGHGTWSHHTADAGHVSGRFPWHGGLGPGPAVPFGYQAGGSFHRPGSVPGK
jgi:hypothetical protein